MQGAPRDLMSTLDDIDGWNNELYMARKRRECIRMWCKRNQLPNRNFNDVEYIEHERNCINRINNTERDVAITEFKENAD